MLSWINPFPGYLLVKGCITATQMKVDQVDRQICSWQMFFGPWRDNVTCCQSVKCEIHYRNVPYLTKRVNFNHKGVLWGGGWVLFNKGKKETCVVHSDLHLAMFPWEFTEKWLIKPAVLCTRWQILTEMARRLLQWGAFWRLQLCD